MSEVAKRQFVRQQGFGNATPASCAYQYPALMFQPRLLGVLVLLAILFQSAALFLILAAILWWNVLDFANRTLPWSRREMSSTATRLTVAGLAPSVHRAGHSAGCASARLQSRGAADQRTGRAVARMAPEPQLLHPGHVPWAGALQRVLVAVCVPARLWSH